MFLTFRFSKCLQRKHSILALFVGFFPHLIHDIIITHLSKIGNIGGSIVVKGAISRSNPVRLVRNNTEIYRGRLRSLKRFKNDAKEVTDGMECGLALEGHNDIKQGDIIESFVIEKTARRLDSKKK